MVTKKLCNLENSEWNCNINVEVEPVQPVQINIFQSNNYRKDWLHFDDETRIQEMQQVKNQHTQIGAMSSLLMKSSFKIFSNNIKFLSDSKIRFLRIKFEVLLEF